MKRVSSFILLLTLLAGSGWYLRAGSAQGSFSMYLPLMMKSLPIAPDNITSSGNGASYAPYSSADGAMVAFLSEATNLVSGDTNGVADAFVWNRLTDTFRRVSITSDGVEANAAITNVWLSGNGQYALFLTDADNLTPRDTNASPDLFRHDLATGTTELVSILPGNVAGGYVRSAALSADGNTVVFTSVFPMTNDPFPTTCVEGGPCYAMFLRDMAAGSTTAVLTDTDGVHLTPIADLFISADGQTIVYARQELCGYVFVEGAEYPQYGQFIYRLRRDGSAPGVIARSATYTAGGAEFDTRLYLKGISADGAGVGYWGDYSSSSSGGGGSRSELNYHRGASSHLLYTSGTFAPDGEFTANAHGDMVIFTADDTAVIVPGDTNGYVDLFRYLPATGTSLQLTFATDGAMAHPSVATDGRTLYFQSDDTTLGDGDRNGVSDIFVAPLP